MHVLIDDDLGRLTLRRLWPWHRLLARCLAPSLDQQLADGVRPEASAALAARAMVLTSVRYRCGLAASLRRMLAASVSPQTRPRLMTASRSAGAARQPYVPLRRDRIACFASELDGLARSLAVMGPVEHRPLGGNVAEMLFDVMFVHGFTIPRRAAKSDLAWRS